MEGQENEVIAQIETSNGRFETWPGFSYSDPGSLLLRSVAKGPVRAALQVLESWWCYAWDSFLNRGPDAEGVLLPSSCVRGQSLNANITDGWRPAALTGVRAWASTSAGSPNPCQAYPGANVAFLLSPSSASSGLYSSSSSPLPSDSRLCLGGCPPPQTPHGLEGVCSQVSGSLGRKLPMS